MSKHKIDVDEMKKAERDPTTLSDVEDALRQVMSHPASPAQKSENREPTKPEIQKRWKLERGVFRDLRILLHKSQN